MFEAKLGKASTLKKLVEAIDKLVQDVNFECSASGVGLQAMDSAHVSLVAMLLRAEAFETYRCDRNTTLGINLQSLSKILKVAGNDDSVTLKAQDGGDNLNLIFEGKNRISEFELKLMDIENEKLGIPETDYKAIIKMSSSEFHKIIANMSSLGDTVVIGALKEGVKFSVSGEVGTGNTLVKKGSSVDDEDEETTIEADEEVSLTFALRYLSFFTKATPLSSSVGLSMSAEVPLVVEYKIEAEENDGEDKKKKKKSAGGGGGWIRYYLAPKIEDDS